MANENLIVDIGSQDALAESSKINRLTINKDTGAMNLEYEGKLLPITSQISKEANGNYITISPNTLTKYPIQAQIIPKEYEYVDFVESEEAISRYEHSFSIEPHERQQKIKFELSIVIPETEKETITKEGYFELRLSNNDDDEPIASIDLIEEIEYDHYIDKEIEFDISNLNRNIKNLKLLIIKPPTDNDLDCTFGTIKYTYITTYSFDFNKNFVIYVGNDEQQYVHSYYPDVNGMAYLELEDKVYEFEKCHIALASNTLEDPSEFATMKISYTADLIKMIKSLEERITALEAK